MRPGILCPNAERALASDLERLVRRALPTRLARLLERLPAEFWTLAGSTGWYAAGHAVRLVLGLVVGLYVARYLGPEAFGTLNYALSFAVLFAAVAGLGLADVAVRELVARPERQAETLGSLLLLRLASGTLAVLLIVGAAAATQADPITRLMIVVNAAAIFLGALDLLTLWFRSQVATRPLVLAGIAAMAVACALRVAFVLQGKPVVWFAFPALVDAALYAALLLAVYRRRPGPPLAAWRPSLVAIKELLARAWPLALADGCVRIQERIDQVMLGALRSQAEVGWYAAAVRLSDVWHFFPYAISLSLLPAIVRARAISQERAERLLQALFDALLWLAILIALPTTLLAGPLVRLLYGEAYGPTVAILQIHVWTFVFVATGVAIGQWIVIERLSKVALAFSLVAVASNVLLNLLLIPRYGAPGAAWATLATSAPLLLLRLGYRPTRPVVRMLVRALAAPGRWLGR